MCLWLRGSELNETDSSLHSCNMYTLFVLFNCTHKYDKQYSLYYYYYSANEHSFYAIRLASTLTAFKSAESASTAYVWSGSIAIYKKKKMFLKFKLSRKFKKRNINMHRCRLVKTMYCRKEWGLQWMLVGLFEMSIYFILQNRYLVAEKIWNMSTFNANAKDTVLEMHVMEYLWNLCNIYKYACLVI